MQLALRPFTTAGVALVGASVIAVSPLAPPPVTTSAYTNSISTAQVALTSTVDPLTRLGQFGALTAENLGELANYWIKNPAPVGRQIITNLLTYADWVGAGFQEAAPLLQARIADVGSAIVQAGGLIQAGEPEQALTNIGNAIANLMWAGFPLMNLLSIPNYMAQHFTTVVSQVFGIATMSSLVGVVLGVPNLTLQSLGGSAQDALDAFEARDVGGGISAIVNTPIDLIDTVLNSTNGGLIDVHYWGTCGCRGPVGGAALNLLLKLPERLAPLLALPAPTPATASLAVTATGALELPTADPTPAPKARAADSAPEAVSEMATEADSEDITSAPVRVSPAGASDLSDRSQGESRRAVSLPAERAKASLQNAGNQVDKGLKGIRNGIERSVKALSDNISKAGKKRQTATSSATAADKTDKAGGDD